jgi:hypothetical protein
MVRARVWLTCAAVHDPVSPVLIRPAVIGWQAKHRQVDLTIERIFKGDELLARMKGWVTSDVREVDQVLKSHGWVKLFDDRELIVECETEADFETLSKDLAANFGDQVNLERIQGTEAP